MILRMQKLILTFKFIWIFKIQVGTGGGVIDQTPPPLPCWDKVPKTTLFLENSPQLLRPASRKSADNNSVEHQQCVSKDNEKFI